MSMETFSMERTPGAKFLPSIGFTQFVPRYLLSRFLVHYELFRRVVDLPGCIADVGVYHGASLFTFAKLLEIFCASSPRRKVIGFDTFSGFPALAEQDGPEKADVENVVGGISSGEQAYQDILRWIEDFDKDRFLKHIQRIEIVKGNICETLPAYINSNPGLRFSLVNIDCDIYLPTKVALECLWPRLIPGGILILDDYGSIDYPGETEAVDEFFKGQSIHLEAFPWHSSPAAYVTKV